MSNTPIRAALLTALIALGLGLAACGSDDSAETTGESTGATTGEETGTTATDRASDSDEGGEGANEGPTDEDQIVAAIEALLLNDDNEFVCNDVYSESLLRFAYGDIDGCLNGRAPAIISDSIKSLKGPKINGDEATAVVVAKGGFYGGDPIDIVAVRDGDTWKIKSFIADIPAGP